MPNCILIPFV